MHGDAWGMGYGAARCTGPHGGARRMQAACCCAVVCVCSSPSLRLCTLHSARIPARSRRSQITDHRSSPHTHGIAHHCRPRLCCWWPMPMAQDPGPLPRGSCMARAFTCRIQGCTMHMALAPAPYNKPKPSSPVGPVPRVPGRSGAWGRLPPCVVGCWRHWGDWRCWLLALALARLGVAVAACSRHCFTYIGSTNGPIHRPNPVRYVQYGCYETTARSETRKLARVRPARCPAWRIWP
jgi:hypothetical protein